MNSHSSRRIRCWGHAAWNDWPWKLHRIAGDSGDVFELYNLADDAMETADLSTHPEHKQRFDQMKRELDAWMRSVVRSINGADYRKDRKE